MKRLLPFLLLIFSFSGQSAEFTKGPIFLSYGENAVIEGGLPLPDKQYLKVMFDISEAAAPNSVNQKLNSVARFINMHVRAGVPFENIETAIVVHGKASFDLTSNTAFQNKFKSNNASNELLRELLDKM